MADRVRRRFWGGVLPWGRHASISRSSLIHCASVSMVPPHPRGAKRPQSHPVQARTGPSPKMEVAMCYSRDWDTTERRKQQETEAAEAQCKRDGVIKTLLTDPEKTAAEARAETATA